MRKITVIILGTGLILSVFLIAKSLWFALVASICATALIFIDNDLHLKDLDEEETDSFDQYEP